MCVTETRYVTAEPTKYISQEKCRRFLENAKLSPINYCSTLVEAEQISVLQFSSKRRVAVEGQGQDSNPFCPANNDT